MAGHLAIVWHSRTGAAEALARAAAAGAGANGKLIAAAEATPERLLEAAGYLFVCPENLGTISGMMKEMFDLAYYSLLGRIEGRGYATIVTAGSAGQGAQAQMETIARGWRLRRLAEPIIVCCNAQTPEAILGVKRLPETELARSHALGQALAEGLALGIF